MSSDLEVVFIYRIIKSWITCDFLFLKMNPKLKFYRNVTVTNLSTKIHLFIAFSTSKFNISQQTHTQTPKNYLHSFTRPKSTF